MSNMHFHENEENLRNKQFTKALCSSACSIYSVKLKCLGAELELTPPRSHLNMWLWLQTKLMNILLSPAASQSFPCLKAMRSQNPISPSLGFCTPEYTRAKMPCYFTYKTKGSKSDCHWSDCCQVICFSATSDSSFKAGSSLLSAPVLQ